MSSPSKVSRAKYAKRIYDKRRAVLNALKDVPCADCDGRFNPWQMDFDHRPDETKLFDIGSNLLSKKLETILLEVEKCDVVCANCHRNRTHERGLSS